MEITSPSIHDIAPFHNTQATHPLHPTRRVTIGDESMSKIFHYEVESDIEEEEEETEDHQGQGQVNQVYQDAQQNNSSEFQEITYEHDVVDQPITQESEEIENWQEKNWEKEAEELLKLEQEAMLQQQKVLEEQQQQQGQVQQKMDLRVFAGNIGQGPLFHTFSILVNTTADELIKIAVNRFGILDNHIEPSEDTTIEYYIAVQGMDGGEFLLSY